MGRRYCSEEDSRVYVFWGSELSDRAEEYWGDKKQKKRSS